MELNKLKLTELLNLLKSDNSYYLDRELEDLIADNYGVLNDDDNQIPWLEFIINNYA